MGVAGDRSLPHKLGFSTKSSRARVSMSRLPQLGFSSIVEMEDGHGQIAHHQVRPSHTIKAWFLLLTGLLAWASTGPLYVYLPPDLKVRPFRVALWRYIFGFIPFSMWFMRDVAFVGLRQDQKAQLYNLKSWPLFSALAFTTLGGFTFFGLSVANCQTFALAAGMAALNPFLLMLWQLIFGRQLGYWQWVGLALGIFGAAAMLFADGLQSVQGTAQALIASIFFTSYAVAADVLSSQLPFAALMSITFGIGAIIATALTYSLEATNFGDGPESFWGFAEDQHAFGVVLTLTLAYIWGLTGMTASAKHLPALVLAVGIALEPLCSVCIIAVSANEFPGGLMTMAMVLLVAGSIVLGCAEAIKGKPQKDAAAVTSRCSENHLT